ncbi:MAG: hypothetical protein ACE5IE_04700, partial [Dehalococcoidia bacterium]
MRNLSSTLLQAQRSSARLPYIKVEVVERVGGVTRLSWSRLYTGSEGDFYHAATMPGDGSLLRARVDPNSYLLYLQRVANPGPASNFGSWTGIATVSSVSGIALSSSGSTVLLFYVATDQSTIYARESNDNGASFGSAIAVVTAPSAVGWLAADFGSGGVVTLFYSLGGTVYAIRRSTGSWGSPAAWTNSASAITGLACVYMGDWNIMVTGQDSTNNYKVWTCVYGDGYSASPGTWSSLAELTLSSAGSGVEFHCPYLTFPDVFRAFFVERYTGTDSYSRPFWSHSLATADFISNLWREPVPFDLSSSYGMAIAYWGSYVWLSIPFGVWQAPLSPASVTLTEDVTELTSSIEPNSGKVTVVLRNDDGRYGQIGSGDYAAIKEGSELLVSPGYRTTAAAEFSSGPSYWIEGWDYTSQGGRSQFLIQGGDGWWLLDRWRARRQFSWAQGEKNVFQLLSFLFARAGLEFSAFSTSSALVNQYPAFTIHPRESGATAVRRLLDMVPDVLFFVGDHGYVKNPSPNEVSAYSYGSDHAILEARYSSGAQSINRVQVYGDGIMSERFDWEEIAKVYDRLGQVHDLNLDTLTKAEERGDAELREEKMRAMGGEILVPTNCGQDLYDVIDISDERAGLTS